MTGGSQWASGPPPPDVEMVLSLALNLMAAREGLADTDLGGSSVERAQALNLDLAAEWLVNEQEASAIREARQWALAAADYRPGELNQVCAVLNRAVELLDAADS